MNEPDWWMYAAVVAIGLIYCLPMIIAQMREHHQRNSIAIINFFLGWTVLAWILCLAWAVSAVRRA